MFPALSRFVLLRHELPADSPRPSHWDLLLEREGRALTWALEELPQVWGQGAAEEEVAATRLADHRLVYFDYEGPISNGRGEVARVFAGTCQWQQLAEGEVEAVLACNEWRVRLWLRAIGDSAEWRLSAQRLAA